MKLIFTGVLCFVSVSALPFQPGFSLAPGQPGALPGLPGAPQNGLPPLGLPPNNLPGQPNNLPGQPNNLPGQPGFSLNGQLNNGLGGLPAPGQPFKKKRDIGPLGLPPNNLPGQPNNLPGQPNNLPGQPNNLLGQPNNLLGQPGFQPQPGFSLNGQPNNGLGGLPAPVKPLKKKRGVEAGEAFRHFSLPSSFSPPSFSPAIFGGSNSPVYVTIPPPMINKRSADRHGKLPLPAGSSDQPPRMRRGLFGGDEPNTASSSFLPPTITLPRVKRTADLIGVVSSSVAPTGGSSRVKRGIFSSDSSSSTGLPIGVSVPVVTPTVKARQ